MPGAAADRQEEVLRVPGSAAAAEAAVPEGGGRARNLRHVAGEHPGEQLCSQCSIWMR